MFSNYCSSQQLNPNRKTVCIDCHDRSSVIDYVSPLPYSRFSSSLVMPDAIGHLIFLDSLFHGNDKGTHTSNSRLISTIGILQEFRTSLARLPHNDAVIFMVITTSLMCSGNPKQLSLPIGSPTRLTFPLSILFFGTNLPSSGNKDCRDR